MKENLNEKVKKCSCGKEDNSLRTNSYRLCFITMFDHNVIDCKYRSDFVSIGERLYQKCYKNYGSKDKKK